MIFGTLKDLILIFKEFKSNFFTIFLESFITIPADEKLLIKSIILSPFNSKSALIILTIFNRIFLYLM
jgi:hypothetical protein